MYCFSPFKLDGRNTRLNHDQDALISLNPNPLVRHLGKLPKDFTREDLIKFARDQEVRIVNLCHVAEDGRLKTLNFAVGSEAHLIEILSRGERVDGSSLFSYIEQNMSDVYIKPRLNKVFLNPFNAAPTLNVMCDYFDDKGKPLEVAPQNVLLRAQEKLLKETGVSLRVLCELEFYIIAKQETETLYPGTSQKNYQESSPFVKSEQVRSEILTTLAFAGLPVKYGHAEVGVLQKDDCLMEQHEVELQLEPPEDMADHVSIAKWIIRNIGAKQGVEISFAPKLVLGHAGNGMHVHISGIKNGESIMTTPDGRLSDEARAMMGGVLKFAPSLTAFGNMVPTSYLRLVPQQEAPTQVFWGYKNREALIRVPLGWRGEENDERKYVQTFELRLPDGSANICLLLAGILMAVDYGLIRKEEALRIADETLLEGAKFRKESVKALPTSCYDSAKLLEKHRDYYERGGVFPKRVVDGVTQRLRQYDDQNLIQELKKDGQKAEEMVRKYRHFG